MRYAEADPGFEADGSDTAHKWTILTGVAFGRTVDFADVHVEGIRHISSLDIAYATELGNRIKLLGVAGCTEARSEEHTSELQSLMRISYAVFCVKKKNRQYIDSAQESIQKKNNLTEREHETQTTK